MKASVATIKNWVKIISDDYMHFNSADAEYVSHLCCGCEYEELPNDAGIMAWVIGKDFDCKKRMYVVILYVRPEQRGRHYLRYMLKRLEVIAREAGAEELMIGHSTSGYKGDKFDRMLGYYGYSTCGYMKRI